MHELLSIVNLSPNGQNDRNFADDIFRCIFSNEIFGYLIKISQSFVPKSPIDNNISLVQIMVWRRIGDESLSELMLTLVTDAEMRHLGEVMVPSIELWYESVDRPNSYKAVVKNSSL